MYPYAGAGTFLQQAAEFPAQGVVAHDVVLHQQVMLRRPDAFENAVEGGLAVGQQFHVIAPQRGELGQPLHGPHVEVRGQVLDRVGFHQRHLLAQRMVELAVGVTAADHVALEA